MGTRAGIAPPVSTLYRPRIDRRMDVLGRSRIAPGARASNFIMVFREAGEAAKPPGMDQPSPLMASLHVALGGGIGALLRYQLGRAMTSWMGPQAVATFPWATLAVNAIGSVLMGMLAVWLARHGENAHQLRLLLGVGLLGGFTTFSAFSFELVMLMQRGQFLFAGLYLVLSVGLGVTGLIFGLAVMRMAG